MAALLERVQLARNQAQEGNMEFLPDIVALLTEVEGQITGGPDLVKQAWAALSYSERQGMHALVQTMAADTGALVTSKVADGLGCTRSLLVNALRKLESAGVIVTYSLGMKGTHIKSVVPNWRERILDLAV